MATAAGAAVLLCVVLSRKLAAKGRSVRNRRISRRPAQAPATWLETLATLAETLRFTYSKTLGKWHIGDLAFGINCLMRRQGNLQVTSVYGGGDCVRLKGPEIITEFTEISSMFVVNFLIIFRTELSKFRRSAD